MQTLTGPGVYRLGTLDLANEDRLVIVIIVIIYQVDFWDRLLPWFQFLLLAFHK